MISRRQFVRNGLILAIGSATLACPVPAGAMTQLDSDARYALLIDTNRCMGCNACVAACKVQNNTADGTFLTTVEQGEAGAYPAARNTFLPLLCNQCDDPKCMPVCPSNAISKLENGVVVTDWNLCDGNGACIDACPYDARVMDPRYGKVDKCDFCLHRLANGKLPACVESCPAHARLFGDLNAPAGEFAEYLKQPDLFSLLPHLNITTNVRYTAAKQS